MITTSNKTQTRLKELIGKTIDSIDTSAVNIVYIKFTDGTKFAFEPEPVIPHINLYGINIKKI